MPRRILNIVCRQRIQIDAAKWVEEVGVSERDIPDSVREYMVQLALSSPAFESGAIVDARRDRL